MNYKKRIGRLSRGIASGKKTDLIVLTTLPSLRYFFNYAGESYERFACGLISPKTSKSVLVIPKLDEPKAKSSEIDSVHAWTDNAGYRDALKGALAETGGESVSMLGCEDGLAFWQMEALRKATGSPRFESISEVVGRLRVIKDDAEILSIKNSARILSRGYKAIREGILRVGLSETDAGLEIRKTLSDEGAASVDFCAVQSGVNSATPHLETTKKRIETGDSIVVDISIRNEDGYFADFTRTFVAGTPRKGLPEIHALVEHAQKAGVAACRNGARASDVDAAARSVINDGGMGDYFFHRTGHGIGLEVHEPPWIAAGNKERLKSGMAFTVEPGIYVPDKFGVRIEDNVIVSEPRSMDLTKLDRDLVSI